MDFSNFKNFYLMHCFSKEEYRREFNSGEKIYIKAVQYFHDLEDEFQRDFEGGVFRQPPNSNAFLLKAKPDLTVNQAIDNVISHDLQDVEWIIPTSDFKFYVNGYIFCFTLIPKCYLEIRDGQIIFNKAHNIADSFYYLLNQYTKDSKYTYISLYDAQSFMETFYPQMANRCYKISYGCVDYENLSQAQRCKYFSDKNIAKLIFTKDERFNYQNEFRIFLHKTGEMAQDHIEEAGIYLQSSVVNDSVYLSREYVNKLGWGKNEI